MKFLPRLLAISLISVLTAVHAAQPDQAEAAGRHGHEMHQGGPDLLAGLASLKDELKLSPAQAGLWQEAETAMRDAHQAMRQNHTQMRAVLQAEQQKDVLDLAKIDKEMTAQHEQARQAHEAVKSKWLAAYESLSVEQKRIVSQRIKARFARMEQRREHFKGRKPQGAAVEPGKS